MIRKTTLSFLMIVGLSLTLAVQVVPGLYILAPEDGQVVTGIVEVRGSVPDDDFEYAELAYAFGDGATSNWFTIQRLDQPLHDATLGYWDTTTISDGLFRLKLVVYRRSGETQEVIVEGIRVANYTHIETPTPNAAVENTPTAEVNPTTSVAESPAPTALPANPASIDEEDIRFSLTSGVVMAVLMLVILGVYTFFRGISRK